MTTLEEFNYKDCELIDAHQVNAYFDLSLDEADPTKLIFDNSWGTQTLDLTPAIKAGETVTHLMLDPETNPVYLRYDNEAGDSECIHGDDLSRIISMKYLKDVYQGTVPTAGDVYMMNGDGYFHTFPLQSTVNTINNRLSLLENRATSLEQRMGNAESNIASNTSRITAAENNINVLGNRVSSLENRMTAAENAITALGNRISAIENAIFNWANDKNTKIARGNINVYGDITNNNSHTWGIFTHATNNNITNDLYFS